MSRLGILKVGLEHGVNAYVVSCSATREALVVDPGAPAEKLLPQLEGLTVRHLLATHGHPGHLASKDPLKEAVGGETAMHMADAKLFLRSADRYLLDGDDLEFGEFRAQVLHTPGHTPGSLCFLVANHLFTGDTLVAGGLGKEMPGTDLRQQLFSIGTKLLRLPPATAIYPGHGPVTSLANELSTNPYLRA